MARLADQRRYLSAVGGLNRAFAILWGEDVVAVGGVSATREQVPYPALYLGPSLALSSPRSSLLSSSIQALR